MADYATPKSGAALIIYTALVDQANTKLFKASPTIAAGDFKVSIDGGALANLATLPTNTPAGSVQVKISLSAAEMTGDNITVNCIDAAGAEWCDQQINIQTSVRSNADLAFPATSGRSMVVDASGLVDANAVKVGPTGSGTAQAAADLGTVAPAIKTQTDKLTFTVANQLDANVLDWKSATAPAMTGDAFARLGAPAGASVSADVAAVKSDSAAIKTKTDSLAFTVAGKVDANATYLNGSATAAARLALSALGIEFGSAIVGTLSTTQMTTDLTEATDDHYKNGVVVWTSGALARQRGQIQAYNGTTKMLTYSAVTDAPANGDTFVIV